MIRHLLVRIAAAAAILLAASALIFFGSEALPGDAATAALGRDATPELLDRFRREKGLDAPVLERYVDWLGGLLGGDLGVSLRSGEAVVPLLRDELLNTAALSLFVIALMIPVSLALALASAVRRDRLIDHGIAIATLALFATPEFVVGTLVAIFVGIWLGIASPVSLIDPTQPLIGQLDMLVLPALTLLAATVAQAVRMIRACMIDVLDSGYVEMARLKGVRSRLVLFRHALPNAIAPTIQILMFNVAWLAGGVVVVENVFGYPGLGVALTQAVAARDVTMVQAITMMVTTVYVLANLAGEFAVLTLNPRLRRRLA